ncbi:hypothetical protein PR202_ga09616 [Eleusine coracana subsp. coracana]|uniref:Uncharacterized protein n=1 Tax=Eleusine coracana subsp. coracana TaxID=191504 RepID=A0AAV5C3H0_ELECO|nr:hypothetical protein PR202_ga09616 [Eleusine coracana subsp. coracana]
MWLVKLEEDKNQLSKGLDPWSNNNDNPTGTTSTLHYLLQEKERAQAEEQLQIYHHHQQQQQQGFGYLHPHHRRGGAGDGVSSGESTPVDALTTAFGSGRIVRSAAGAQGPAQQGVQGWPERMPSWHASENNSAGGGRGGNGDSSSYMFGVQQRQQGLDHQSQLFSQGEPLQSSGGWASARAWLDPLAAIHQPSAMAAGQQVGFSHLVGAGGGGFMGFLAPAAAQRLQGEEEQGSEAMRRD